MKQSSNKAKISNAVETSTDKHLYILITTAMIVVGIVAIFAMILTSVRPTEFGIDTSWTDEKGSSGKMSSVARREWVAPPGPVAKLHKPTQLVGNSSYTTVERK